ncbi:MAG: hypothetical protein HY694_07830 [Deltaproteobacteria bacterium]|nr:hypothetical protein [Deltaproteobacteria bacterium]
MGTALKADWFQPTSVEQTLKNLIASFDRDYLMGVSFDAFVKDLIKEIRFISVYRGDEEKSVLDYIRKHAEQLYEFAQKIVGRNTSGE